NNVKHTADILLLSLQGAVTITVENIDLIPYSSRFIYRAAIKKLLIKEYLNSLSTLTINPDDIFSAINHQDQQAFPCQVCDNC
ncbi:hypothetical protein HJ013_24405, partial [Vibrio parahaemolyticus]|nr:hypothetical protein [Vibrio parahaemolyticus]